jgi:hypothetical protein
MRADVGSLHRGKRPHDTFTDGCLSIYYNGPSISTLNLPGYVYNTDYKVTVNVPSTAASGTYEIDASANQNGVIATPPQASVTPGQQYPYTIGTINYGQGYLPVPPCNSSGVGMTFTDNVYYNGSPISSDTGTVIFTPLGPTPTPAPTATPGILKIWPGTVDYPASDNILAGLGCTHGAQPNVPGQDSAIDPDIVTLDNVGLGTDAEGCEKFNGIPVNDHQQPSVHVHEKDYYGHFIATESNGCGNTLSQPLWWVNGIIEPLGYEANGPSAYLLLHGTANLPPGTGAQCQVTVSNTDGSGKSVSITVFPGKNN